MKAAFLSSSLISSKGSASPATRSLQPGELVNKSKRAEAIYRGNRPLSVSPTTPTVQLQPARAHELVQAEIPADDLKEISENMKKDRLGRVRMSVRMTPEQHLHLKLIAAHTKLSAQSIIEQALDEYVERNGTDLIPGACACIRDKMFR